MSDSDSSSGDSEDPNTSWYQNENYEPGEYSKLREARMARNAAMLESLGLAGAADGMKGEVERRERKDPKVVKAMKEAKERRALENMEKKRQSSERLAKKSYNFSENASYSESVKQQNEEKERLRSKRKEERSARKMGVKIERETRRQEREKEREIKEAQKAIGRAERGVNKSAKGVEEMKRKWENAVMSKERREEEGRVKDERNAKRLEINANQASKFEEKLAAVTQRVVEHFPRVHYQSETFLNDLLAQDEALVRTLKAAEGAGGGEEGGGDYDEVMLPAEPSRVKSRGGGAARRSAGGPISPEFSQTIDRTWLSHTTKSTQFVPQVGDKVFYFADGHNKHLELFPDIRGEKMREKMRVPLFMRKEQNHYGWGSDWIEEGLGVEPVLCSVEGVDYEFPAQSTADFVDVSPMVNLIVTLKTLEPVRLQTQPEPERPKSHYRRINDDGSMNITQRTLLTVTAGGMAITEDDDSLFATGVLNKKGRKKSVAVKVSVGGAVFNPFKQKKKKEKTKPTSGAAEKKAVDSLNRPAPPFQVLFRPIDSPDFLVEARHAVACAKAIKVNERVKMDFDGEPFYGKVVEISSAKNSLVGEVPIPEEEDEEGNLLPVSKFDDIMFEKKFPVWESCRIAWDDSTQSQASVWELFPAEQEGMVPDYAACGTLSDKIRRKLRDVMCLLGETELAVEFLDDVLDDEAPSYRLEIPMPICIKAILERLDSGWYRHTQHLLDDCRRMHENCAMYNEPGQHISLVSSQLLDWGDRAITELVAKEEEKEARGNAVKTIMHVLEGDVVSDPIYDSSEFDVDYSTMVEPDASWGEGKPKFVAWVPQCGDVVQYSREHQRKFNQAYEVKGDLARTGDLDPDAITDGSGNDQILSPGRKVWEYCCVTAIEYIYTPAGGDSEEFDKRVPWCMLTLEPSSNTPYTIAYRPPNDKDAAKYQFVLPMHYVKDYAWHAAPLGLTPMAKERHVAVLEAIKKRVASGTHTKEFDIAAMTNAGSDMDMLDEAGEARIASAFFYHDETAANAGSLDLIMRRISSGYYRQVSAIVHDIKQTFYMRSRALVKGDIAKLQVGLHCRNEGVDVNIPDNIKSALDKVTVAREACATAIAGALELPMVEWVLNLNANVRSHAREKDVFLFPAGERPTDPMIPLPKVRDVVRPFFGPGSLDGNAANILKFEGGKRSMSEQVKMFGSIDAMGLDHSTLPPDPCDYHPPVTNKNNSWPAAKITVRCDSLVAADQDVDVGGKRKADALDGDSEFLSEKIIMPHTVFHKNSSMLKALYGTKDHVRSCFKCRQQSQGFLMCRIKRGHSHPDWVGPVPSAVGEISTPKRATALASSYGLKPAKRPDFSTPNFKGPNAVDLSMKAERNEAAELLKIETYENEYKQSKVDLEKFEKELVEVTARVKTMEEMEIVVTPEDIERANNYVTGTEDGHEEMCYVCGEAGILIMCDSCPKCAHFTCVGLKEELMGDDEDWYCKSCCQNIAMSPELKSPGGSEGGEGSEGKGFGLETSGGEDGDDMQED